MTDASAAITPYGSLYRYGGHVFVALGMAMLGAFVRWLDERSKAGRMDVTILILPLLLFADFVKQEAGFTDLLMTIPSALLFATMMRWLLTRSADKAPYSASARAVVQQRSPGTVAQSR
jgi:hypothetical protein